MLIAAVALTGLAAVSVAGAAPTQTTTPVKVHVSPGTGGPRTTFKLNWRNPTDVGMVGTVQRSESVEVNGPHHAHCVASGEVTVPATAADQTVRMSLAAGRMSATGSKTWCTGTFHGAVLENEHFTCSPPHLCPELAIRPQTIANFTFKVRHRR